MRDQHRDALAVGTLLLLGSLAFAHLTAVPAFEDEGSQLRWIARAVEAGEWLQPLGEGKPLEAWAMVPVVSLGLSPLFSIRAAHVVVGMLGSILVYRLALRLGDRWTAWTCGVLFATCPFVVYLQRFALSDMLLCTAATAVLLGVLRLIERPDWPRAAQVACLLVLVAFCKFPVGFVFLLSMPAALALLPPLERTSLLGTPSLRKLLAAHAPAALLALIVVGVAGAQLRLGRPAGFGLQDFMGIALGKYRNVALGGGSRPQLLAELSAQLSWPVLAIAAAGLAASALRGNWQQRWLIAVGLAPMLAIGLLAQYWFSRYLLFTLPPLIIAAVCGWRETLRSLGACRRPAESALLAVSLGFMGHQSALLILRPEAASWSPLDRWQYFEGPGSGYGYPEAARFILSSSPAPAMVYALDGHSAYQLRTYLPRQWRARVGPVVYDADGKALRTAAARVQNLLCRAPAWIVIAEALLPRYLESSLGSEAAQIALRPIATFDKPGGRSRLALYEVVRR